ncbi:MAG: hypothetical protein JNK05_09190 [Myxococcales bacterium]|nr:hypothetical protein [Myxococcales bacterium]
MAASKATKAKTPSPVELETGQRWAYPLGDGRYIGLQITERIDDRARAIAFEPVFAELPSSAELDRAPHHRFDLAVFNRSDADPRMFACFGLDAAIAPVRATLVDVAPVREDAAVGAPNVPYTSTFAEVAQRVWQTWHMREVTGAFGREVATRPLQKRWQGVRGDVSEALRKLADDVPPIALSVSGCDVRTVDLRAIRAQAIVLDYHRGFRSAEVLLPPHVHTLSIWGRVGNLVVRCAPEGPPLGVELSDGDFSPVVGVEGARVLSITSGSSYAINASTFARWRNVEDLSIYGTSIYASASDRDDALVALRTLSLGGLTGLDPSALPSPAQVPALEWISLDAQCKSVPEVRDRFKGRAAVQRFTKGKGPTSAPTAHYFTTNF